MADNELFGNSEQLDDTISRREALDALTKQADEMSRWCERYQEQRKGVLTARNIIKDLPSAQQWIPCSERLPEEDGEYLTTTEDGLCDVESYGDGEWFYDDVVAWAPLPKPWKGDAP